MIDFQALKQQLELLGHRLPDEQIKAILADMHVEVADSPDVHKGSYENQGNVKGGNRWPVSAHMRQRTGVNPAVTEDRQLPMSLGNEGIPHEHFPMLPAANLFHIPIVVGNK
eukprot:916316-Pelagomonas_calceolata.AAC.1